MKKRKQLFLIGLCTLSVGATVLALNGSKNVAINALECTHDGNHYAENAATTLESGNDEFYVCCKCHEIFKQSAKPDGTWKDATVKPDIAKGHAAYIEPTVTKAEVEEKLAALESTVAINTIPGAIDKVNYDVALQYKNVYMTKEGSVEADLVGIDNLYGAKNVLSYKSSSKISKKINEWNIHWRSDHPVTFNLTDLETGLEYTSMNITTAISHSDFVYYYQGGILEDLPDTQLQVLIRSNKSFNVMSAVKDKSDVYTYGPKTTLIANEWTSVVFTLDQVKVIKECGFDSGSFYGNNVRIHLPYNEGGATAGTVLDFTTFYSVTDSNDLMSCNVISNENYNNWYNLLPLKEECSRNLYQNIWFDNIKDPDLVDKGVKFVEAKYSNPNGNELVGPNDYCYNGTQNLSCIFFRSTSAIKKNFTSVIFMVYSNEQIDIQASKFSLLNKWDSSSVLEETTLYKGWNALHLDVSKIPSDGLYTFTMTPTKWSTTLQITVTAMFYKAAE